jgi:hypothetical protein
MPTLQPFTRLPLSCGYDIEKTKNRGEEKGGVEGKRERLIWILFPIYRN